MHLPTLRIFTHVMRQGSFATVARDLGVAPSSVSRAIASLEQELGIRLFQRNTRTLHATEAGKAYYQRILPLLDELEAAADIAAEFKDSPCGLLRISAPVVFSQLVLTPLIAEFARLYPDISLELMVTDTYQDLLAEGIDIAIRLGSLRDSSHVCKKLSNMEFFLCASSEYLGQHGTPQCPQEVSQHNCLLFPRQGHNLNWIFKDSNNTTTEIAIQGNYLMTNSYVIQQSARLGLGLALLPDWLVAQEMKHGRLVRLFEDYQITATDFDSAIWLLFPSRDHLPVKVRVFVDFISNNYANIS